MIKFAYQTNSWGAITGSAPGVTSIKDLYYVSMGSTEQALHDLSAVGYQGFEIFDGNLMHYIDRKETIKQLIKNSSLSFVGVYTGANFIFPDILEEELLKIKKVAQFAAELGAEHLIVGGGAVRSKGILDSDFKALGKALNNVANIANDFGLIPSYHPHLGTNVESPSQLDKLMVNTKINLCPDTAHLEAGGGDPVAVVKKYADRIKYIHLKDYDGEFKPLGLGKQNFTGIISVLKNIGYQGWITVELDNYCDPRKGAQISLDYLKKNY